ncbi:hypothetical protein AC579_8656 [Pseudocercospora musae]|uniref:Major facilitator superfamily (MFS) profile domain-containing protein n=1 Tax=Pseudocercospora musae TaxID=113226 RepID=A0A139I5K6_9PEZI|nr:hypothetical protein AC579_8656 [Pseudocercospora musae]
MNNDHFRGCPSPLEDDAVIELDEMRHKDDHLDANQPLIANTVIGSPQTAPPEARITIRNAGHVIRFLTLSAGISGLLFGFDTGVISSTLVSIGSDLSNRPLTTADKSLITAITSLLALFSAPSTGFLADRYGRKSAILCPALLFAVGALVQAFSFEVWTMALGRALVGAAVGVASGAVPMYITELAPAELRGRLVTVQSLFITGGQVVAYLIGWIFAAHPQGWRWMVGVGAIPAGLQLILLFWMPETPRWLLQTGQDERARHVLRQVFATLQRDDRDRVVQHVLFSVRNEMLVEDKPPLGEAASDDGTGFRATANGLLSVSANKRALIIAAGLQGLQQLCGFNSLMYFSATIFSLVGFTSPIGTSLSIAATNFVFTVIAFAYIDSIGRRNILLRSIPFMTLGLFACSISFLFIRPNESQTSELNDTRYPGAWSIVLLCSLVFYVAAYAVGLGCVPWQQSELFPLRVRSLGSGLATATNWSSNFVVGITFLPMMSLLGASTTFLLYGLICLGGWFCVWSIYPETAGLELEEISSMLKHSFGVSESIERFRHRQKTALNSNEGSDHT